MKKYLPFIVALGLPLIFVFGVVVYAMLSDSSPFEIENKIVMVSDDDFVFINDQDVVEINEERIEKRNDSISYNYISKEDIDFYVYNPEEDETEEVSYEDVQKFKLHPGEKSPDGITIEYKHSRNDIASLFGAESQRGYYAHKDDKSKKINTDPLVYYNSLKVVGWIIN
ncbi:MAG: hypothetical protein U9P61_02905 [Patescibacteria group bacterium]|nr:hypothetical protein [Patescibacteria group bacterium]